MRRLDIHLSKDAACDTVISAIKAADPIDYVIMETEQKDRCMISVFMRDGTNQTLILHFFQWRRFLENAAIAVKKT